MASASSAIAQVATP